MKILLAGDCDNGGGSWFLAEAIRRHTKHEAISVRGYQSYLQYPYDVLGPSKHEMQDLIAWADVVHIRDRLPGGKILPRKPVVVTFTGRHFRKCRNVVKRSHRMGWTVCVGTPDMLAFCPEVNPVWLPNPREPVPELARRSRRFSVCQAPTSRSAKDTEKLIVACRQAKIPLHIIENQPYAECLKRKGRAWVTFDQVKYGYGNNAIEAWALGQPAVSGFRPRFGYRRALVKACGGVPFAEARPTAASIQVVLERLRDDPTYLAEMRERGRDHFYRFHHAPVVAHRAIGIYKQAMEKQRK